MTYQMSYLEYLPLNKIARYHDGPPKNALPFTGYPQQHPLEKTKLVLVWEPLGESPAIVEFKMDDIVYVEEVPQAVTEKGEGIPLVKLWIRQGAHGMLLEPFEVREGILFPDIRREQKERFAKHFEQAKGSAGKTTSAARAFGPTGSAAT